MSTDVSIHDVRNVVIATDSMGDTKWTTLRVYGESGNFECEVTLFHANDEDHIDGLPTGDS